MKNILAKYSDYGYVAFRVIVGLVFLLHGVMKVQGIMAGKMAFMSLMGLAAVIETLGGAMLIVGLLVQYVALISAVEMIVAYFMAHASSGLSPLANKGEPAVLFFAAFLVLATFGARKWALDAQSKSDQ